MGNPLEVSGEDIGKLNDSDLRELIGLLCEADCRTNNLSTKGVLWGGHQDANDGGLDIVVEINTDLNSFIPRSNTGFQVKKSNMSASEIIKEMKPNGVLRNSIKSLIEISGSYIIISSGANLTNATLKSRLEAMKEAVLDEKNYEKIHLGFYDRGRIATWVRTHPAFILWVQNRIGLNVTGWQPFGNWTRPNETLEEYIVDNSIRLFDGTSKESDAELSAEKGLDKIRSILSTSGSCVRLTGLSGVGKTRLVQAIFDEKVGKYPLNPSLAFYTDISHSPNPDPRTFANQLIAHKTRGILIVDNCPPTLHRQLTEVCSGSKSSLSLITVEYDVREDLPEETHVFHLEPANENLIFELIRKKYKHINQIDARTIATFSGGNAKVAFALANTIRKGETLSGFQDEQLFERLFFQRNEIDSSLITSAQVISLVYSFDGENIDNNSELSILATLINKSADDLYRTVGNLKERDLVQSRGIWRAILPHAIANRLAQKAFEVIHPDKIVSTILSCQNERLLKSFTRRLNYLHDCKAAVEIANKWLSKGGILEDITNLNHLGINLFENIVPLSPHKTLESIEQAATKVDFTSRHNQHLSKFVRILRSLAFDKDFFHRSTRVICQFAANENVVEKNNYIINILKSLFQLYLSGTHATAETRY
jgi:hypothetical protein